jgi:hypothetical protein
MAVKSKTVEALDRRKAGLLDPAFDGPPFPFDYLQLGQAQQVTGVIDAFGGALARQFVVLAKEGRQPQRLEVVSEQNLWSITHDAAPANRLR